MSQEVYSPLKRSVQYVIESTARNSIDDGANEDLSKDSSAHTGTTHFPLGDVTDFTTNTAFAPIDIDSARLQSRAESYRGIFEGSLDMDFIVTNWRFLHFFLGTTDAGNDGARTHTMTESMDLVHGGFYAISQRPKMDVFAGCVGESMSLTLSRGDVARASMTVQALKHGRFEKANILTSAPTSSYGSTGVNDSLVAQHFRFSDGANNFDATIEVLDNVTLPTAGSGDDAITVTSTDSGVTATIALGSNYETWDNYGLWVGASITVTGFTTDTANDIDHMNDTYTVTGISGRSLTVGSKTTTTDPFPTSVTIDATNNKEATPVISFNAYNFSEYVNSCDIGINHTYARGGQWDSPFASYFTRSDFSDTTLSMTIDLFEKSNGSLFRAIVENEFKSKVIVTLTRGSNDSAVFTFPKLKLYDLPQSFDEAIRATLEFDVLNDESLGYPLSVLVTDDIEDYDKSEA